jgi:hypothetical protein
MPVEITDVASDTGGDAQSAALNAQIEAIKNKYQPRLDALQQEGQSLADEAPDPSAVEAVLNVDFDVTWSDKKIAFDFPSVKLKNKRIAFDLPEVRMDLQRIVFDTPATRMVPRVIGRKPEFHGPFHIEWTDIIISVPEVYMQRNEIKLDIPQVTMKRQEIVVGIPEITMQRVEWIVSLPQFKVINISAATDKLQAKGKELQAEGEAIGMAMNAEVQAAVSALMQGAGGVPGMISTANHAFDAALTSVKSAIDTLSQKGIDPIKVPTDGGDLNLRKTLDELVKTRDDVMPALQNLTQTAPAAAAPAALEAAAA